MDKILEQAKQAARVSRGDGWQSQLSVGKSFYWILGRGRSVDSLHSDCVTSYRAFCYTVGITIKRAQTVERQEPTMWILSFLTLLLTLPGAIVHTYTLKEILEHQRTREESDGSDI